MYILKNAKLVPELTEGFDGSIADVVISEDIIEGIYDQGCVPKEYFTDAEVYDLTGKTLLPGFFDLHTHLYFVNENIDELAAMSCPDVTLACVDVAKDKLRYGYTTVRDCGTPFNAAISVRNAINRGKLQGPRVFAAGRCTTPTTRGNDTFGPLYLEFDDPSEARKVVRTELAYGADFIKYMSTGSVLNPGGIPGACITTREELSALVQAAEENDSYVGAHAHGTDAIILCAECGVKTIEHASYLTDEAIDAIVKTNGRTVIIPTLAIVYALAKGVVPEADERIRYLAHDAGQVTVRALRKAADRGVIIGWGTDIDQPAFDIAPFLEFEARRDAGFSNLEMLIQATITSAKIVGIDDITGSIKAGKCADLIVLAGNPATDYDALTQKPELVFARGRKFVE